MPLNPTIVGITSSTSCAIKPYRDPPPSTQSNLIPFNLLIILTGSIIGLIFVFNCLSDSDWNTVAYNVPDTGLNCNLVVDIVAFANIPVLTVENIG